MFVLTTDHKISDLKSKLSYWLSPTGQKELLNNVATHEDSFSRKFGIQRSSGGYYYLSDNLIGFYDLNNGNSIRIRKLINGDTDWNCFNSLYEASSKVGFRMDEPVLRKKISINSQDWDYVELKSPNGEYGKNFEHNVFTWPPLTNGLIPNESITDNDRQKLVELYKSNIDEISKILAVAKDIAVKNNCGVPVNIFNASSIYRDTTGPFWSELDFSSWDFPVEDLNSKAKTIIALSTGIGSKCGMLLQKDVEEIVSYVNAKWS